MDGETRSSLITGAGMVGAYTARLLIDAGHHVTILDRTIPANYLAAVLGAREFDTIEVDLTDTAALDQALANLRVDGVVHTAALVAARAQRDLLETIEVNVTAPARLADWAARSGVTRFVSISSWSVFSENQSAPLTEDSALETQFSSYYVASKLAMEHVLSALAHASGMGVVAIRPAVIYGYGPNLGGSVGSAVIEEQILRAMAGDAVILPSNIISQTELVFVEDVAARAAAALTVPMTRPFAWFTAGSGESTTLDELAELLRTLFPAVDVSIAEGEASSVIPPRQSQPTDPRATSDALGVELPLRRVEGFQRFIAQLGESGARGIEE
ncbi:MAG: NAD-dependent epimerase/dehydratase family protein [Candidatus Microbacterium stercoravium]